MEDNYVRKIFKDALKNEKKVAIFSGRFDPFHVGHFLTLNKLFDKYDYVFVVILDYKERCGCDLKTAVRIFVETMKYSVNDGQFCLITHNDHFGKISCEELKKLIQKEMYGFKIKDMTYVGGNKKVNKHIESLGLIPVEYIPRSEFYNATEIREDIRRGKKLEDIYGIDDE